MSSSLWLCYIPQSYFMQPFNSSGGKRKSKGVKQTNVSRSKPAVYSSKMETSDDDLDGVKEAVEEADAISAANGNHTG